MDLIKPYVVLNDDPQHGDNKWYAVDEFGSTSGPFENQDLALQALEDLKANKGP